MFSKAKGQSHSYSISSQHTTFDGGSTTSNDQSLAKVMKVRRKVTFSGTGRYFNGAVTQSKGVNDAM